MPRQSAAAAAGLADGMTVAADGARGIPKDCRMDGLALVSAQYPSDASSPYALHWRLS
jgi:hypothetical protein